MGPAISYSVAGGTGPETLTWNYGDPPASVQATESSPSIAGKMHTVTLTGAALGNIEYELGDSPDIGNPYIYNTVPVRYSYTRHNVDWTFVSIGNITHDF